MTSYRVLFFLFVYFFIETFGKELYLITTPNILLSDAVHKFNVYTSTNTTISIETTHLPSNITNRTDVVFLTKGYHSIPYFVPFIGSHLGSSLKLRFLGDNCSCNSLKTANGKFINETREIDILNDNFIIFAETDKPIYRPGELVKLRAMAIYVTNLMLTPPPGGPYVEILFSNGKYDSVASLRKKTTNFDTIFIETPDNVKMSQWRNVSFEQAMNLSFQLNNDPMMGQWKVTIILGSIKEVTSFTVKKYVLPRFVVDVQPPSAILLSDTSTNVTICSTYSTGKTIRALIQGEMCINIDKKICRVFVSTLNGTVKCVDVTIQDKLFGPQGRESLYFRSPSTISVTVRENGTTNEVTKSVTLTRVKRQPYEIKFRSKKFYKPGLPYFGKLSLKRHDGSPQKQTRVLISADSSYEESWGFQQNFTSNNAGIVKFVIPYIPVRTRLTIQIIGDRGSTSSIMDQPTSTQTINGWESVDNEYIQILPHNKSIKCPGTLQLSLLMNGDVSSVILYAQLMSRGLITNMIDYTPVPIKCTDRNDDLGHYRCAKNGQLRCLDGWMGDNCRQPVCSPACHKGACVRPNTCVCKAGWLGQTCDDCVKYQKCLHGYCVYGNDCQCLPGWTGYQCDRKGPIIIEYTNWTRPIMTTQAPKPRTKYEKQSIFERIIEIPLDKNIGPDLRVVVYYINSGNEVVTDSLEINKGLSNCSHVGMGKFRFNKKTAVPGEKVKLFFDPGTATRNCALRISDVALSQFGQSSNINLGFLVDKLIQLNSKITKVDRRRYGGEVCLKGSLRKRSIYFPGLGRGFDSRKSFVQAGLTPITNARVVNAKCWTMVARGRAYDGRPEMQNRVLNAVVEVKKQIREFFPETWIFNYYRTTPAQLNFTVPDSMTSWKANSFCMTEKGIWIPPTRYLTVILPFFADIYVPYSIKLGEQLQLPVKLFNYVAACYEVVAEISVNATEIKVKGPTSSTVCLCHNDVITINFNIQAKIIGKLNVTVHAKSKYSSFCSKGKNWNQTVTISDSIRRQLLVEPPGIPSETTFSEIICSNNEHLGLKTEFNIPSKIVEGSLRSYVVYNGDVMGQTFDNLDRLVQMPYGCGEQNMVALVPSIYVLNYLTNLKIWNALLVRKAKQYIEDGYRRQLTYKHDDGSYSAFGKSDGNGSTWLTAFVLKSFTEASKYVSINKTVLKESVAYLEKMQLRNGCFRENGKLLSGTMAGGLKNRGKTDEGLLTAYVLISLANVKISKTTFNISSAIACVQSGLINESNAYRLALSGYALSLHSPQLAGPILTKLQTLASTQNRYRYWKSGIETGTDGYAPVNSADIETTGYALLALNHVQSLPYLSSVIYWLSRQQNSLGGYFSTQDTVVALHAIAVYAEKIGTLKFKSVNLTIDLDGRFNHTNLITDSDRLVTRKLSLGPLNVSYVSVKTNGTGCVAVQLQSLYNIEKVYSANEVFGVSVKSLLTNVTLCTVVEVELCSWYLRKDSDSNMVLVTVDFPSGWELSNTEAAELRRLIMAPLKRIDFLRNKIHLYYDSFSYSDVDESGGRRCLRFRLNEVSRIKDLRPAFIRVVDYYKPEVYTDTSYAVPLAHCKLTNETKPVMNRTILCPKYVNETTKNGVRDFMTKICSYSNPGMVAASARDQMSLKGRSFYMARQSSFLQWTVDLEPTNCSCLRLWPNIRDVFTVINDGYLWVEDTLTLSNTSTLFSKAVFYEAYRSDLGNSCYAASNFVAMLNRLLPDFKTATVVKETCASCILNENLYFKIANVTKFLCSEQNNRWTMKINSISANGTINGTISNKRNGTVSISGSFPLVNCFCLHKLNDSVKNFELIDLNNRIRAPKNAKNFTLNVVFDHNFQIVESAIFDKNVKFDRCKK